MRLSIFMIIFFLQTHTHTRASERERVCIVLWWCVFFCCRGFYCIRRRYKTRLLITKGYHNCLSTLTKVLCFYQIKWKPSNDDFQRRNFNNFFLFFINVVYISWTSCIFSMICVYILIWPGEHATNPTIIEEIPLSRREKVRMNRWEYTKKKQVSSPIWFEFRSTTNNNNGDEYEYKKNMATLYHTQQMEFEDYRGMFKIQPFFHCMHSGKLVRFKLCGRALLFGSTFVCSYVCHIETKKNRRVTTVGVFFFLWI